MFAPRDRPTNRLVPVLFHVVHRPIEPKSSRAFAFALESSNRVRVRVRRSLGAAFTRL